MQSQHKKCTACGEEKPYEEFHRDKHHPTGRTAHCKKCKRKKYQNSGDHLRQKAREKWSEMSDEKREERNRRYRERYHEDPDKYRSIARAFYRDHSEEINEKAREMRRDDPIRFREYHREWLEKNRVRANEAERKRRKENPEPTREASRRWRNRNRDVLREVEAAKAREMREISKRLLEVPPGSHWLPGEDALLLADNGMTVYQKAIELGRTYASTQWRNSHIRKEVKNVST